MLLPDKIHRDLTPWLYFLRYHLDGRWRNPPRYEARFARACHTQVLLKPLQRRLRSGTRPSIWYLPTQTWFSSGFQRPQQMARAFAELGHPVVFCEPWNCNKSWLTSQTIQERCFVGVRDLALRLHLLRAPADLLPKLITTTSPDVVMLAWPYQAGLLPPGIRSKVVYEMIDDHSLEGELVDDQWKANHAKWLREAAVVAGSADDLVAQLRVTRPDALLMPNGVRIEDWELSRTPPVPTDMQPARRAPVVVGYYGALAEWFDWATWESAARLRPDWAFVLIGYPYDGDLSRVRQRLQGQSNIWYLGPKAYDELPAYLHHFDVATIPFVLNQVTHACSPVKLFEYMAAEKPVVCSPMREILKYKAVLFATGAEEFVAQCETARTLAANSAHRALLLQTARENSWKTRASQLLEAIAKTA